MTKRALLPALLAMGLLSAACGPLAPPGGAAPGVRAIVRVAPDDRGLQAVVVPWRAADIDHVNVELWNPADPPQRLASRPLAQAALSAPVVFDALAPGAAYRLVARAYADGAEAVCIDAWAALPASCALDFTAPAAGDLDLGALPLRLANKPFAADGDSGAGVGLQDGTLVPSPLGEGILP